MSLLTTLLLLGLFCLLPAGVTYLCRRISLLRKIGPIMVLYALGMVIGNLPVLPEEITTLQNLLPNIVIPLAIPMMLFSCHFSRKEAPLQLKVVISGFLSVALAVTAGYLLFGRHLAEGEAIGGIITGMYTGGTLNAAALQTIFQINSEIFLLINSYDILISFLYFVFLFSFGIRMFRQLYGQPVTLTPTDASSEVTTTQSSHAENPYRALWSRSGLQQLGKILGITLLVVGISAGIALLMPEEWFMVTFILMISTLGILCSFVRPIRELHLSYDLGMYLIYIFSLVIASMADFSQLNLSDGINQLAYMSLAVFLSLFIHATICRFWRVDADSMIISSVAFINSPPFVPMAAAAMRNKESLLTGLGAGIVGYAAGNHLGVLLAQFLTWL